MRTVAICYVLGIVCTISAASGSPGLRHSVDLIAPLYIVNEQVGSTIALRNETEESIEAYLAFRSLEGEETARTSVTVPARSTVKVDVDTVPMTEHRFPTLGSVSVASYHKGITAHLIIRSRTTTAGDASLEEDFYSMNENLGSLRVGHLPSSFSVPVIALHNVSGLPQRISIVCSEATGKSYESQLMVPGLMTFLVNGCVSTRTENRTYKQILSGDTGPLREEQTIRIKLADSQGGSVYAWGFAAMPSETKLQLTGVEFTQYDPVAEFLLEPIR